MNGLKKPNKTSRPDDPEGGMGMAERTEVAARVLDNYATALRGDWSSIDGRSERHSLNMLSAYLRGERESISERDLGVCMMTDHPHWMRTHWTGEGWGHECEWF